MPKDNLNVINIASRRDNTKVWTPAFRGGFVNVHKPKTIPGTQGEPTYSIAMLFDEGENLKHLKAAVMEAVKEKWGADAKKVSESPKFRDPFKDQGEMVSKSGDLYAGMVPGATCVTASSKESHGRPQVVDRDGKDLIDKSEVYSGAWYRATIKAYAWDHPVGGKGVSFGLQNIQKLDDGERLGGGRRAANDDFEPLEEVKKTGTDDDDPSWD